MPDLSSQLTDLTDWLSSNAVQLLVGAGLLLLAYRLLKPWTHRVLVRLMHAQRVAVGDSPAEQQELDRRVETIEDLITKVLRGAVILGMVAVVLGVFNLWPMLTGLGLVVAALTLAGQSIILDVLMGILILVEAQYFKGDIVQVAGVEGVVEEVGIRRTLIRDARGTLHSISNANIRQSANLTRTYAAATIDVDGVADGDVEAVIRLLDEIGAAMAADPGWDGVFQDTPAYAGTIRLTAAGSTLRLAGRVRPDARARVEADMRRRIAGGLAANGIQLIRPTAGAGQQTPLR
ncbi:MAG TPA: mechanosensitive ion channel domain-containing protein [Candidatus Limnocylindrales bacterium]|nr:mechanosensitive ion channel domain-containing protein [Candidatus Limnocylindrales bacterium]